MLAKPAIEQREHNSETHARNIGNPILHIRTASKGRLYELDETAKCACTYKDWNEPNAACTRQWKGQSCEGHEVYKFIASIRRWRRLMDGPEHGHRQNSRHDECEGDVEVLAHAIGLTALGSEHKEKLSFESFTVKAKATPNQRLVGSDKRRF